MSSDTVNLAWRASDLLKLDECALCDATRDHVPIGQ
jgi:hypothetical protein